MTRRHDDIGIAGAFIALLAVVALIMGIRFLAAGGDALCMFAQDPALCIAVKESK